MMKTKFTAFALTALMTLGTVNMTAFATESEASVVEVTTKTEVSARLNQFAEEKGITVEEARVIFKEIKENKATLDGLKNFREAKNNFSEKLTQFAETKGITVEEAKTKLKEMKENERSFKGLKNNMEEIAE